MHPETAPYAPWDYSEQSSLGLFVCFLQMEDSISEPQHLKELYAL